MIHLIFFLILISIISNALFSSMNRINNKAYHYFEVILVVSTVLIGYCFGIYQKDHITFTLIYTFLRFGLYSIIFNKIVGQKINYIGQWGLDRFLRWLLYDKLNQSSDLIIYLYFMSLFIGIGLYLKLLFY